jgi:hypothetical protein
MLRSVYVDKAMTQLLTSFHNCPAVMLWEGYQHQEFMKNSVLLEQLCCSH